MQRQITFSLAVYTHVLVGESLSVYCRLYKVLLSLPISPQLYSIDELKTEHSYGTDQKVRSVLLRLDDACLHLVIWSKLQPFVGLPYSTTEFYMQLFLRMPWQALIIPSQHVYVLVWNASYGYAILNIMHIEYNIVNTPTKFQLEKSCCQIFLSTTKKVKIFYHEQFQYKQWISLELHAAYSTIDGEFFSNTNLWLNYVH